MRVVYEARGYDASFPRGMSLHRTLAVKEPDKFFLWNAHGYEGHPWEDAPTQTRAYIQSERYIIENPFNRWYRLERCKREDALPGSLNDEIFLRSTGLFPMGARRRSEEGSAQPAMLRDLARSEAHSIVRDEQELVAGRWCHVLEAPSLDVLWIDHARGFCLVARECVDPKTGAITCRFELERHEEVVPGIWIPRRVRRIFYDFGAKSSDGRRHVLQDGLIEIREIHINSLRDDDFRWQAPPGALRVRTGLPAVQTSRGGIDHLDGVAHWVRTYTPTSASRWKTSRLTLWFLLAAGVVVISCELLLRRSVAGTRSQRFVNESRND